ncbi:MAG: hypothetical protein JST86_08840 [Bacteroidetes bacterium]|nr:hypothetical protein [Bacteroidota bacterium]
MAEREHKSPHILNASSNLLGICFVVLTSLRVLNISQKSLIDEFTTAAIILFMASCILSFLSIRGSIKNESRLEKFADYFFLTGISLLFITTILFSLNIIH